LPPARDSGLIEEKWIMGARPRRFGTLLTLALVAGCAAPGAGAPHAAPAAGAPAANAPPAAQAADAPHTSTSADAPHAATDAGASHSAQDAGGDSEDVVLAKKLSNPVANLISVPFQFNYDHNIGPKTQGDRGYLNFQPVIPIELDEDWNVISRTIVPVIDQHDLAPTSGDQSGLGDVTQSFFFSPKAPTKDGWIWGVGPALLIPTANDDLLGSGKYGAGPTAVFLKQEGPWTYGALGNHIWSYAGDDDRRSVSNTYLQPFISYTTHEATTYALNTESNYNWETDEWSVPLNLMANQLMKFGDQLVQVGVGLRYWVSTPDDVGPEGFGLRLIITPLFPK